MINRRSIKESVRKLRKEGYSFRDIAKKQKLPVSTVYLWSKDIKLTPKQIDIIQIKHDQAFAYGRKIAQRSKHEKYIQFQSRCFANGFNHIKSISKQEINLIGVALYWGEGFKKDSRFGFANSDPSMITFILNWLNNCLNVKKEEIRLRLGLNINLINKTNNIQQKWIEITGIPKHQYQKPFYQKTSQIKTYKNSDNYLGVLRIRVNNHPELLPTIMGMIAKYKK